MSRTNTFSRRPWRHTGKFNRKKEDMVNTDEDVVDADKDIVNTDKEKILHDRDSQDRGQTVRRKGEDAIREIVDEVVNGVVEKENNIIEDSGQQRCYKIFNQVVKRRRLKNLISLRSLKMAREKSLHLMLLDLITVRLNILNINQKIKEIEEVIRKKIEPRKKEIALVETETKIAVVKPNQRIEEHTEDSMPVLPEQNINEENYEIDDANEAQIN